MNLYSYGGNSPVNKKDHLGLYITFGPGDYTNWNNQFAANWQNPAFQNQWNAMQNTNYDFHYSSDSTPDMLSSITGWDNLRLDDDGTGPSHGDPDRKNTTSMRRNGHCLNADRDPYIVAPGDLQDFGVRAGDMAFAAANNGLVGAPVGDFGPSANGFGEVSVAAAQGLGVPTVDAAHVGPVIPDNFGPVPGTFTIIPSGPIIPR